MASGPLPTAPIVERGARLSVILPQIMGLSQRDGRVLGNPNRSEAGWSGSGQTRSSERFHHTSAQAPRTEFRATQYDVVVVPIAAQRIAAKAPLLDHLIGEDKDRIRDRQPDRLRGSEIEDHVELRGLFHG
jgi:hypothetical protein